ncbi:MAG: chromate resistance protein [Nitrospirae bacterium]|nr:chromate resistance protein [Nitrospirota bacterium]
MKHASQKSSVKCNGWILFFYTVPSKPVSSRMKVWRKLMKAGAVQLKGAVYILPYNDDHYELLQWLVSEITEMKGEGAFTRIEHIDSMNDSEIIYLFDQQRASDYRIIGKALDDLEGRLNSIKQGGKAQNLKGLSEQFDSVCKDFEEVRKIDFFFAKEGEVLNERIKRVAPDLKKLSGTETKKESPATISSRAVDKFRGKTWLTRKKPFIDRMASAWLIRRFIDKDASFDFINERDLDSVGKNSIVFDMRGGEFTHVGELCTFEVLVKSFGFKDKTLKKMAEIVHDLDLKDEKYKSAEAKGLEDILIGIRKTAKNDAEALEKGMTVFEMLYASKSC